MRIKLLIPMENALGERIYKEIIGNKRKIKLNNGEIISVMTDKRKDMWFVTDVISGILLIPQSYYGLIVYDEKHNVFTENNALETAKHFLDNEIENKKMGFYEMLENRCEELNLYENCIEVKIKKVKDKIWKKK